MSSSIAHELNQPLGAILNNAETINLLLGAPSPDLEEIREIVGDILRADRRAGEVILRLRSLVSRKPFRDAKHRPQSDRLRGDEIAFGDGAAPWGQVHQSTIVDSTASSRRHGPASTGSREPNH